MTIGEKIQQLRTQKRISQEELASSIGVSRQAISKWETDQSTPDLENIKWLAEFFQVKLSSLIEEGDIQHQAPVEAEKSNTLLRVSRFLFILSIGMSCWFVIVMLFLILFQDVFFSKKGFAHPFVFPIPSFVFNTLLSGILIGMNLYLWKETKKVSKGISIEIVHLIISIILPFIVQFICAFIEQIVLENMISNGFSTSSYSTIMGYIGNAKMTYHIGLMLFVIGTAILLSAKHISKKGYIVCHTEAPFSIGYGILSFTLGFISLISIPLMAYWLQEIRQIDSKKYKQMRIPFLVGVCVQGFIRFLSLVILILIKLSIN